LHEAFETILFSSRAAEEWEYSARWSNASWVY